MAIVVKQASNTPLMLGQLAETLANTYLQHNQQKQQWDKYEQERIWKNEDRDRFNQSIVDFDAMKEGTFQSGAHRASARNDLMNNRSWGSNLPTAATSPEWMGKRDALAETMARTQGLTNQQAQDSATFNILNATKSAQDPMGMSRDTYIPGMGAATGSDARIGSIDSSGDYTARTPPQATAENPIAQAAQMESATMGAGALGSSQASPALPQNDAEFAALPSGAWYKDSEGIKQKR